MRMPWTSSSVIPELTYISVVTRGRCRWGINRIKIREYQVHSFIWYSNHLVLRKYQPDQTKINNPSNSMIFPAFPLSICCIFLSYFSSRNPVHLWGGSVIQNSFHLEKHLSDSIAVELFLFIYESVSILSAKQFAIEVVANSNTLNSLRSCSCCCRYRCLSVCSRPNLLLIVYSR